jgi:hypothetical protein
LISDSFFTATAPLLEAGFKSDHTVSKYPYIAVFQGEQYLKCIWIGTCVIIDGAAGGETKRRHDVTFPLLTLHHGEDFSTGFSLQQNIVYTGVLQIFHTHNR